MGTRGTKESDVVKKAHDLIGRARSDTGPQKERGNKRHENFHSQSIDAEIPPSPMPSSPDWPVAIIETNLATDHYSGWDTKKPAHPYRMAKAAGFESPCFPL